MLNKTILTNQLAVISLARPDAHSCALGLWLENGSRHQQARQNGYAHLLEHLLLRANPALTAQFEILGGQINGHSGRELTAWYGLVPARHSEHLLALLAGALLDFQPSPQDFDGERRVVLQELANFSAGNRDALSEQALASVWPDQPIGYPLLGDPAVLQAATVSTLQDYLHDLCVGSRLAVVAVGAVDHARLLAACSRFDQLDAGRRPQRQVPSYRHQVCQPFIYQRDNQALLQWLLPAARAAADTRTRTALLLADHMLGGGLNSRLYRTFRECYGLSYYPASRLEFYSDTVLWKVQLDCAVSQIERCGALVARELQDLIGCGPQPAELERTRGYLAARLQIMQDEHLTMMQRLAREHFYFGVHPDVEDYTHYIYSVAGDDIRAIFAAAWR